MGFSMEIDLVLSPKKKEQRWKQEQPGNDPSAAPGC
jgi:hypothetical protein